MAENTNPDESNVKMPGRSNPELTKLLSRNNSGFLERQGPVGPTRQRTLSLPAGRSKFSELANQIQTSTATLKGWSQPILPDETEQFRAEYKAIKKAEAELLRTADHMVQLMTSQGDGQVAQEVNEDVDTTQAGIREL